MTKNTGKPSEKIFDDAFQVLGKRAYVFTFTDASEATGMNRATGRATNIKPQPSDRLVTVDRRTYYAEVKSSVSKDDRFDFKLLRSTQGMYAAQIIAAGGEYLVFYHHLSTDEWFCFPYSLVRGTKDQGKSSIPLPYLRKNHPWNPTFPTMTS